MRLVFSFLGIAATVVVASASCNALPALGTGCGNKVIDDGEDCDGNYGDATASVCIAPGQVSACHFSCDGVACPATFTCGAIDHVCRRPSGTFGTFASIAGEPARRVLVGDFDGDQAADVVTVGLTSRVHFFDGHDSTQQALLSSDASNPALGHVTTDGRTSGIVTNTYVINDPNFPQPIPQGNVRVWRGSPDRTLLPTVYPNIDLTAQKVTNGHAISVLRANQLGSDVFALLTVNGTTALFYVNGTQQTSQPFPLSTPLGDISKIHGTVPVGTLGSANCSVAVATAFNYCQAIVLAFEGDKSVSVHSSCDKTSLAVNAFGPQFVPPLTFTLPNNDTVAGPAFLFAGPDPSPTGTGTNPKGPSLFVVGKNAVYEFPPADDCTLSGTATTAFTASIPGTTPLALGFIADLKHLAWVTANGVFVDSGAGPLTTSAPANTVWKDAIIGDMNLNGLPDVVAVADGSIDFYNGTGSVLLNGKHITLDGTATHMTIGDFDGDFVSDIAVSTHADSTGLASDSIDIAFGTFTGFPIQPVSVGRLANLAQLEPTFFDYRISGSPDLINTLFAMGTGDTGDLVVSILQGNPDRLINSPYFLFDPTSQDSSLVTTAVGDFAGTNHEGIAGVSVTSKSAGLWFTPMTGDAQVDVANTIAGKLPSGVTLDAAGFDRAGIAAIDVGGASGKELLVVEAAAFFLTAVPKNKNDAWPSLAYEALQNVAPTIDRGIVLHVADADGDGDEDAIVGYVDAATKAFAAKIVLNAMNGTLSWSSAPALALPEGTVGITPVHASKDGSTQIAAVSPKGIFLAQISNGVLGPWSDSPIVDLSRLTTLSPPVTVHDVVAGDVDGDGVEDIVIATSSGFIVYFGDPA